MRHALLPIASMGLTLLLLTGCAGGPDSPISGALDGAENGTVTIGKLQRGGYVPFDTAQVDANGAFAFGSEALAGLPLDVYQLTAGERQFYVIADSLSSMRIAGTIESGKGLATDITVEGDTWSAAFAEFVRETGAVNDSMLVWKARATDPSLPIDARNAARTEFDAGKDLKMDIARRTVRDHKADPVGLLAIEYLDLSADRALAKQVLDSTQGLMGHTIAHRNLSNRLANVAKPRTQQRRRNDLIQPGMAMPDIALNDPDGKERALSDLRGKVVLVDFWASWCGPCRRENPNVVRAWNEYHDRGFEVFSVSLDRDVAKWQRAIKQDGLVWDDHISDLKGWSSVVTELYGISSIPHAILIDRDGTVGATHLRGNQLERELDKLL